MWAAEAHFAIEIGLPRHTITGVPCFRFHSSWIGACRGYCGMEAILGLVDGIKRGVGDAGQPGGPVGGYFRLSLKHTLQ